ncbi:scarecrow-like protein 14 [Mercurialis annua]|uniref:scarecrow-like protein 14 n=1 Tax=Mercurialis annua TaxID=3986 RepID=UPI00215FF74D|nr:scarecrow-like protein 14 [Mercurialis annua]
MGTDAGFGELSGLKFGDETDFLDLHQYPSLSNGYKSNANGISFDLDFNILDSSFVLPCESDTRNDAPPSVSTTTEGDSPSDDNDFSDTILSYIREMLMEEDMEQKPCMFHDPLVLQAAEKSLHDVLGEKCSSSPDRSSSYGDQFLVDSPCEGLSSSFSDYSCCSSSVTNASSSSAEQQWSHGDFAEYKPLFLQTPIPTNFVFQSTANCNLQQHIKSQNRLSSYGNDVFGSFESKITVPNLFSESNLALQFQRGVEEANKFLPKVKQLVIDLEPNASMLETKEPSSNVVLKRENEEGEYSPNSIKGKRNHKREDEDFDEERSNKQSAIYVDETELAEMFDKVLVCTGEKGRPPPCIMNDSSKSVSNKTLQQNGQTNGSNGGKTRAKRQISKEEVVDLRTLMILCAQAVSGGDQRTANELLKQIRHHSSPFGDGSQRLAHCFANGLEARLAGTGAQIYTALSFEKASAADMLKAYLAYISACPFTKIAIIFTNHTIMQVSKNASTLHIIDFGILYGFQWPALIYRLSKRPGGPPKLRITGIELPQSGFRPGERVQETGRRLAKYCELHKVPFEYNAIAKKWENVQIDDLKINNGEFVAVSCLLRSKNLLDETVMINSPKNAVLNLIRKTNPNIFIHSIVNGSYNAPFFVTRFREALFHFSALFDMFDANMSREDQMRLKFEKEFFGREALNVIACEGSERVERPESYKQWQVRSRKAGLKQLPLDDQLVKKLRSRVEQRYNNDFVVNEDCQWMLQGWKGRIICASSAWVPA